MNEKRRVTLSIIGFCLLAMAFVAGGIYGVQRMGNEVRASELEVVTGKLVEVAPESVGLESRRLARIDSIVHDYIDEGAFPGAVVGVVRDGKMVYRKAFGYRQTIDDSVAMTVDTRFDLASLTKPVAVATSIMQLVERGEITLGDRVDKYIPEFRGWASEEAPRDTVHIRIADLLTHTSGLPPYVMPKGIREANPEAQLPNADDVIRHIAKCDRWAVARTERIYSCLNYITLARVVEIVTGKGIDVYANENIFAPLGMSETCYLPSAEYALRCAPTEKGRDGRLYRGVVHDPLARDAMGGVSGNAGLFSTLDDLSLYVAMLLNGGSWSDAEILSSRSVDVMLKPLHGYEMFDRTPGWENFARCSQTGGDLLSSSTVGHTGATGTSIVIDPEYDIAVIVLTNYVHSTDRRTLLDFRSKMSTIVGASIRW